MIQLLVAYGADPLVRLMLYDFPGRAFTQHTSEAGSENWSSTDYRVSLLHLAVVRANLDVLNTLIPIMRTAHFTPIRLSSVPLKSEGSKVTDSNVTQNLVSALERTSTHVYM